MKKDGNRYSNQLVISNNNNNNKNHSNNYDYSTNINISKNNLLTNNNTNNNNINNAVSNDISNKFYQNNNNVNKDFTTSDPNDHSFVHTSCILYVVCIFLFLIWTLNVLWEHWNQIINPVSSTGFDMKQYEQLLYPAITICSIVPNTRIEPKKCSNIESSVNCEFIESRHYSKTNNLKKGKKATYCLTYNSNIDSAFVSKKKGLEDILFISVNIKDQEREISLDSNSNANYNGFSNSTNLLNGVVVSLHSQNKKPNIHSDTSIIASPGKIVMLRLKKVLNEYLNMTSIESFEAQTTDIETNNFINTWGNKESTVVIALSYQNLSVMVVSELPPYKILSFLSETGGIIGLLLGSSCINLCISLVQWFWGVRMNEIKWFSIRNEINNEKLEILRSEKECGKNKNINTKTENNECIDGNNIKSCEYEETFIANNCNFDGKDNNKEKSHLNDDYKRDYNYKGDDNSTSNYSFDDAHLRTVEKDINYLDKDFYEFSVGM